MKVTTAGWRAGWVRVLAVMAGAGLMASCGDEDGSDDPPAAPADGRVVFVGASITDGWDFDGYFPGRDFIKVVHYAADKTEVWGQVAGAAPEIVVVKECAAYFYAEGGTPLAEYQAIIADMVARIRAIGATPVLATTLPIDVGYGDCTAAQLADVQTFNAWLRTYCAAEGIPCLDLSAAVADGEGQLPTDCHDGDGLHPNEAGYNRLSPAVLPVLEAAGL